MGIRETTEIIKHLETLPEDAMLGLFKAWLRVKLEQAFEAGRTYQDRVHGNGGTDEFAKHNHSFETWFKINYETK